MPNKKIYIKLCLLFLLLSCEEEIKLSFSEITPTTVNNTIVKVNIPEAMGIDETAYSINSKIHKHVIESLHIGDAGEISSRSIEESINLFNEEFNAFKLDFPETNEIWEAQIDGDIMFLSSEIVSIAITTYKNTGGAHGNLNISILNFNAQSGKEISNEDLFTNYKEFQNIAQNQFDKKFKEQDLFFENTPFQLPINIGYTEKGILLLYNTYEIAPYSSGTIELTIPFHLLKSVLAFNRF
jgi:hypothetical protein